MKKLVSTLTWLVLAWLGVCSVVAQNRLILNTTVADTPATVPPGTLDVTLGTFWMLAEGPDALTLRHADFSVEFQGVNPLPNASPLVNLKVRIDGVYLPIAAVSLPYTHRIGFDFTYVQAAGDTVLIELVATLSPGAGQMRAVIANVFYTIDGNPLFKTAVGAPVMAEWRTVLGHTPRSLTVRGPIRLVAPGTRQRLPLGLYNDGSSQSVRSALLRFNCYRSELRFDYFNFDWWYFPGWISASTSSPDAMTIAAVGPETQLPSGSTSPGDLYVGVSSSATEYQQLHIMVSPFAFNDTLCAQSEWGVLVVGKPTFWGDLDTNGVITGLDAVIVFDIARGVISVGADQFLMAELDGDGCVSDYDVYLELRKVGDPNFVFPVIDGLSWTPPTPPNAIGIRLESVGQDVALYIEQGYAVTNGKLTVNLPQGAWLETGPALFGSLADVTSVGAHEAQLLFAAASPHATNVPFAIVRNAQVSEVTLTGNVNARDYVVTSGTTDLPIEESLTPATFSLAQNYPNPFNPTTTIEYTLPSAAQVRLTVYNVLGQEVASLLEGEREAGRHRFKFDAAELPSGVYVYRLEAGTHTAVRRMIVMK